MAMNNREFKSRMKLLVINNCKEYIEHKRLIDMPITFDFLCHLASACSKKDLPAVEKIIADIQPMQHTIYDIVVKMMKATKKAEKEKMNKREVKVGNGRKLTLITSK